MLDAPASAGIFTDFDGTLSEIVDVPEDARPVPGAIEALTTLAGIFEIVGVLSGRPVDFLQPMFPPSVLLAGLYGLERLQNGERIDHPLGGSWREVIDDVASVSRARGPAGMNVESKGLSITLHYREPSAARAARACVCRGSSRAVGSRVPAGADVVRAAPADPGRQGQRSG